MQKILLSIMLLLSCVLVSAQAQEARRQKQTVQGKQLQGYSFKVPYAEHQTQQYWTAYLKDQGKISERRQFIEIREIYWFSKQKEVKVYSTVTGDNTSTEVWIGYDAPAEDELLEQAMKDQLEKLPFLMRKYQLLASLKDAEDAATFQNRELENSRRQENKLSNNLKRNADEKVRLEQQLVKNGEDKLRLEQELKDNKKKQEEQQVEVERVNKQLEALKEKLSQLESE